MQISLSARIYGLVTVRMCGYSFAAAIFNLVGIKINWAMECRLSCCWMVGLFMYNVAYSITAVYTLRQTKKGNKKPVRMNFT